MAVSEGAAVRHAIDGPKFEHDELIAFIGARNAEDADRASSAGESREEIGAFIERTGINKRALSLFRSMLKQSPDKANDIIRSIEKGLPMVKQHLNGQQSEMDLEPAEAPALELADALPKPTYAQTFTPGEASDLDADSADFEAHLAEVSQ